MKSTLPATHLLRHFVLFALTVIFLLTVMRSAYGLWQFPKLEASNTFLGLFIQGLRFDLAVVGIITLVPVVLGSLLAMSSATRWLAKVLIMTFLFGGLALVLLLEILTPWFVDSQGVRPDLNMLSSMPTPLSTVQSMISERPIPALIGVVLSLLILVAFWRRMEMGRFLRYRLSVSSALSLAIIGGLLCLMAIWSTPDLRKPALSPAHAAISNDNTVNELTMNSAYKALYSVIQPYLER